MPWGSHIAIRCGPQGRCAAEIVVVELGGTGSGTASPSKEWILLKIHRKGVRISLS
jgi:hypothetical protein